MNTSSTPVLRQARRRLLAAPGQHAERRGQDRAADAEAHRVDLLAAADGLHFADGADGGVFDVVVPGLVGDRLVRVAPTDDEHAVALAHQITDQRVLRLQIKDVVLVDARRHKQHRPLVHLGRERLVLEQLEQIVLEHHRAFAGGDVFADFEDAGVGLRDMALLHIAPQVRQPLRDALALGFERLPLRLGVERKVVARAGGVDPLLHRKAHARLGLGVAFDGVRHLQQRARVQQIGLRGQRGGRVGGPVFGRKAPVSELGRLALRLAGEALDGAVPHLGSLFHVLSLQRADGRSRQREPGCGLQHVAHRFAKSLRVAAAPMGCGSSRHAPCLL
jgi:hypothetical protein